MSELDQQKNLNFVLSERIKTVESRLKYFSTIDTVDESNAKLRGELINLKTNYDNAHTAILT